MHPLLSSLWQRLRAIANCFGTAVYPPPPRDLTSPLPEPQPSRHSTQSRFEHYNSLATDDLHYAVNSCNVQGVKDAIAAGADVNALEFKSIGDSPLMHAAIYINNDTTILELLISAGADLDPKQCGGGATSVLSRAVLFNHRLIVEKLLEAGADPGYLFLDPTRHNALFRNWNADERPVLVATFGKPDVNQRDAIRQMVQDAIYHRTAAALSVMPKEIPQQVLHKILTLMWYDYYIVEP